MADPARTLTDADVDAIAERLATRLGATTPDEWIGADEVAKMLGVKRSTIPSLVSRERLPCYRPGKAYTFRRSEVEAWLLERVNRPGARPRGPLRVLRGG